MIRMFGLEPINKLFYHNERVQDITLLFKFLTYEIKYLFGFINLLFLS